MCERIKHVQPREVTKHTVHTFGAALMHTLHHKVILSAVAHAAKSVWGAKPVPTVGLQVLRRETQGNH